MECIYIVLLLSGLVGLGLCRGTDPDKMKSLIIGRCWEYQLVDNAARYNNSLVDCEDLWNVFIKAFKNKPDEGCTPDDYDKFVRMTQPSAPKDKALFWAQSYPFDKEFSNRGQRFTVITDTLGGYMLDGAFSWCGQKEAPGYKFNDCGRANTSTVISFWRSLSRVFARTAEGRIQILLNGSKGEAFKETSVLAQYEVPNWSPENITEIHIWIVHNLGDPHMESCGTDSSAYNLEKMLRSNGFTKVSCTNDPMATRYLQCADQPNAEECQHTSLASANEKKILMIMVVAMAILFVVSCVGFLVSCLKRRSCSLKIHV